MSFVKHSIAPINNRSSYPEFSVVDFNVSAEGRKMVCNSFRLVGKLNAYSTGTTRVIATNDINYDGRVGAGGVIESIQTEITNLGGVVESFNGYGRYVGMSHDATRTDLDLLNGDAVCELKTPMKTFTKCVLQGEKSLGDTPLVQSNSFSIKPQFILNTAVGMEDPNDLTMSYNKSGNIRISFTLARNFAFLFGNDVDNNSSYDLTDLRLEFMSVPEDGKSNKTAHKVKYMVRSSLESGSANIQAQVPAKVNACSISFIKTSRENVGNHNNYRREVLPNLTSVQYLFNNATNEYIQYRIDNRPEWSRRAIESFRDTHHSELTLKDFAGNHSFLLGLNFGEFIDLTNQTFSVQLESGATSTDPYTCFLYFHSVVEV
jgi:hypothetical protein